MNIYQKDGKWLVEVKIDSAATFSRPAYEHEIPKAEVKAEPKKEEKPKAKAGK